MAEFIRADIAKLESFVSESEEAIREFADIRTEFDRINNTMEEVELTVRNGTTDESNIACWLVAFFLYNTKHRRTTKYKSLDIGRGGN